MSINRAIWRKASQWNDPVVAAIPLIAAAHCAINRTAEVAAIGIFLALVQAKAKADGIAAAGQCRARCMAACTDRHAIPRFRSCFSGIHI